MKRLNKVKGAIELPGLLSFLADNSVKTKVQGLNDFPKKFTSAYDCPLFL